jgi:hypothetical protein
VSRVGLVFCAAYAALIAVCFGLWSTASDSKGGLVWLQLPIAPQGALLDLLGLGTLAASLSWFSAYLLLALPTFFVLYVLGKAMDRKYKANRS